MVFSVSRGRFALEAALGMCPSLRCAAAAPRAVPCAQAVARSCLHLAFNEGFAAKKQLMVLVLVLTHLTVLGKAQSQSLWF